MSNPYATPSDFSANYPTGDKPLPPPQSPGMVNQVRVVSVLMMVQGALDLLTGLGLITLGIFMGFFMHEALREDPNFQSRFQSGTGPSPEVVANMMTWVYGGLGFFLIIIGGLQLYAGFRNWKFRSRTLGIISLLAGLGTVFSCYCAPTSLALCIYGLIVYLNGPVANAFQLGEQGYTGDEVIASFSGLPVDRPPTL